MCIVTPAAVMPGRRAQLLEQWAKDPIRADRDRRIVGKTRDRETGRDDTVGVETRGRVCETMRNVRSSNPAPTSSTTESAICAMTSALRDRWRAEPAVAFPAPASASRSGESVPRSAGARPNNTPLADRNDEQRAKHSAVERDRAANRQKTRAEATDKSKHGPGARNADDRARKREHDALGEELARESQASSA